MNSILDGFDVREATLDNGLRVIVREDRSAAVAAVFTHVLAGYFDEPDEWVGISHVLEHMYFKGTPTRGPGAIAQATKSAGGYLNASTIYDHTSYYTVLPSSSLEDGLDIQSDALINSLIDEEELRKELLVIIQEANRKQDNPSAMARESLYEMMFDRHRIRRWRIGREAQLKQFTRGDVAGFFEQFYRAPSIILVVAGDVDAERVFELVGDKYARIRQGEPARDRGPAEPAKREFRFRELSGDVVQTRVEIGWHTEPTLHPETPYLDILALILGQGRASHLYRRVREAGLASGVSAHNYTPTELGIFGITAEAEPAETLECIQAIFATVDAVRAGSVTDEDVRRAQSVLEARMLRGLETMEGQASFIADWAALGDWQLGRTYLDTLMRATREDVQRVAEQYLDTESAAVLTYRPQSAAPLVLSADDVRAHAQ
jgi:zinc protease